MFFRTQWNDGRPKSAPAGGEVAGGALTKGEQSGDGTHSPLLDISDLH